ncbi:hypothetical protein COB64_00780 [Candidatus Wolfebacteria bacterium]|nr:MAG: hypothetical protein COB64_00780 [Candidatus Wolfebacteria bacterium]
MEHSLTLLVIALCLIALYFGIRYYGAGSPKKEDEDNEDKVTSKKTPIVPDDTAQYTSKRLWSFIRNIILFPIGIFLIGLLFNEDLMSAWLHHESTTLWIGRASFSLIFICIYFKLPILKGGFIFLTMIMILVTVIDLKCNDADTHNKRRASYTENTNNNISTVTEDMYLKDSIAIPVDGSYAIKSTESDDQNESDDQKGLLVSPGVDFQFSCPDCVGLFIMKDNRGNLYDYVQGKPIDIGTTIRNPLYTFRFDKNNHNRDKAPMMYLWEQKKKKRK